MELATLTLTPNANTILCKGAWVTLGLETLEQQCQQLPVPVDTQIDIDGQNITELDFAGAWLLHLLMEQLMSAGKQIHLINFKQSYQSLLQLIREQAKALETSVPTETKHNYFYRVGKDAVNNYLQVYQFLNFLGNLVCCIAKLFRHPRQLRWRELLYAIESNGYRALPIIALLSMLIGVVLAYQMGLQLKTYGANIFIVDLSSMAILREFAPLITAIILSGRTSAAFTAEIGTMKVGEEIDALEVMGLSAINQLVVPKLLALLIVFPLLTIWADGFGMLGSMLMTQGMLGIHPYEFILRFHEVTELRTFLIGMVKGPVFAFIIAFIGCYQGFQVSSSAASVGQQTTRTVVQTIFFIVVADAIFSVIFSWQNL